jgi:spore germination cell wall hydrolase CwlJ-like protein
LLKELIAGLLLSGAEASEKLETAFLAANIYHEARAESVEGQLCVAHVTIARAGDKNPIFGGPALRSVVFKKNVREDGRLTAEFSWWEKPTVAREYKAVAAALDVAKQARAATKPVCSLRWARYYKNSAAAGPGGSCWFARNAVYLGSVGNHDFYRPHRSVFEWKHGMAKNCYGDKMPTFTPRIPRPRPPFTSSVSDSNATPAGKTAG